MHKIYPILSILHYVHSIFRITDFNLAKTQFRSMHNNIYKTSSDWNTAIDQKCFSKMVQLQDLLWETSHSLVEFQDIPPWTVLLPLEFPAHYFLCFVPSCRSLHHQYSTLTKYTQVYPPLYLMRCTTPHRPQIAYSWLWMLSPSLMLSNSSTFAAYRPPHTSLPPETSTKFFLFSPEEASPSVANTL